MATVALVSWQHGTGRTTLLGHLASLLGAADGRVWTLDLQARDGQRLSQGEPDELPPHWLAERLRKVGAFEAEWLLIDTPVGPDAWTRQAVQLAHLVLVVTRPEAASFCQLAEVLTWIAEVRGESLPSPASRVVVTHHRTNDGTARQIYSGIGLRLGQRLAPPVRQHDLLRQPPLRGWDEFVEDGTALADVRRLAVWLMRQATPGFAAESPTWPSPPAGARPPSPGLHWP